MWTAQVLNVFLKRFVLAYRKCSIRRPLSNKRTSFFVIVFISAPFEKAPRGGYLNILLDPKGMFIEIYLKLEKRPFTQK